MLQHKAGKTTAGAAVHLFGAAALYYAIVFGAGLVLGPIRVLWLEPHMPRAAAVACEGPALLIAMYLAARLAVAKLASSDIFARLALGLLALLFEQASEIALGVLLFGRTVQEHVATFMTPAGGVSLTLLVAFVAMPLCARPPRACSRHAPVR